MSPAPSRSDPRLVGALFVLAAVTFFAGLDTTSKAIGMVPVAMAMWFRYAAQACVTAATLLPRRGLRAFATRHPFLQALRGTLLLSTSVCTYLSLRVMPVGELTAIVMLTPLLLMLVAAFVFGEAVSPLRWALIALSFGGAMMVVRPGGQVLSTALLLPLGALGFNTAFHLTTSRLAKLEDVSTMQLYTGVTGVALASLALPFFWVPLADWHPWALLGLVCVCSTAGHWLLVIGYAKAGIATLTPLLFAQIAVSTLFGGLFFAHVPDAWALAGICLIAVGGAACTWLSTRERAPAPAQGRDPALLENASMEH
jgi:drug/metabolite transporter (DMT)-like permease